jgi:ceramide glucosyltransferase
MTIQFLAFVQLVLVLLCFVATGYAIAAAVAMPFFNKRPKYRRSRWTSVSLLKPLCGVEPCLYENLATFCEQVQLVFN